MCIEDIRLGRQSYSREDHVSVGTSLSVLVPNADNRISLVISAPTQGNVYISVNPNDAGTNGIQLSAGMPPLQLTIQSHGGIVRKRLYVVGSASGITVSVWSNYLDAQ